MIVKYRCIFNGKFNIIVETNKKITCAEFYLVKKILFKMGGSLISYKTANELVLITIVNQEKDTQSAVITKKINKHKDVFSVLRKLKG